MKIVVNYLNSVFHIDVQTKSNDKCPNFVFQFIKNTRNGTLGTRIMHHLILIKGPRDLILRYS